MRRLVLAWLLGISLTPTFAAAAADTPPQGGPERTAIPFKSADGPSGTALAGRVLAGFVVVLIVGIGGVYLLKRYAPGVYSYRAGGGQRIQIVEIRRVTPRLTLFLVQVDGDEMLLAQSGDRLNSVWQRSARTGQASETRDA